MGNSDIKKILVTGHRGMVGSAVCRRLSNTDCEILTAPRENLDLTDERATDQFIQANRPDVVIFASAKVGGILANDTYPVEFLTENLTMAVNTIGSSFRHGVSRFLFLGSTCIYPRDCTQPIEESSLLSGPLEPTNEAYALAKIAGLKLCQYYRRQHGVTYHSAMPTNLYGPGDNYHPTNSHVLPALIRRFNEAVVNGTTKVTCWGSGTPLREFLHADDLGDACKFVLENWRPGPNELPFLNVGTGIDVSIRELAEAVASVCGYKGEIQWDTSKPDGTPKKQLDVSRLAALGWQAKINLSDGLTTTTANFRDQLRHQLVRL